MSIPLNITMEPTKIVENVNTENNQNLKQICFEDFYNNTNYGFGGKRISVDIEGTITKKYPFRAFGYRDENLKLYIGMRRYCDQGDGFKIVDFDPSKTITNHIVNLVQVFEQEEKNNKNNLNIQTLY